MEHNYPEILGNTISYEDLHIDRVREMANAVLRHPHVILNQLIRQTDGTEILIVTFDNQIKQHPVVDIKEYEEVAIICDKGNINFPKVYALRDNFPLGLPHTNLEIHERPVSLCVSELLYKEVEHNFNPYLFLENIRDWFSLSSSGELHQEDQLLEPYFHTKGFLIIPPIRDLSINKRYSVKQISHVSSVPLYSLQLTSNKDDPYICDIRQTNPQVSGFIHKKPTRLGDIRYILSSQRTNLTEELDSFLNNLKQDLSGNRTLLENKYSFLCIIPIKRHAGDEGPERSDIFFITIDESFKKLGIRLGLWTEHENNLYQIIMDPKSNLESRTKLLDEVPISMYTTLFDFIPDSAAYFNGIDYCQDVFSIIGVGALGSQILNNLCRMGFGKWNIIDNDTLLPHNLARHLLGREHVGFNKSFAISFLLNHLVNSGITQPYELDVLNSPTDILLEKLKGSKAIIDTSTSIAVARRLALDFESDLQIPRISIFLSPSGNDLVLLAEDQTRTHRLDLLEMQYYRSIFQEATLHEHLKKEPDSKIRLASNSCRDITQKIRQDTVSLFSAIASNALKQILSEGKSKINIWHIENESFEIKIHEFAPSIWEKIECEGWTIFVDKYVISKIYEHRNSLLPSETGGVLTGSIDLKRKIIYLLDTLLAPPDSIGTKNSFIRGTEGIKAEYDKYLLVTDNQILYLGEWHSHPRHYSTNPSVADVLLFSYLSEQMKRQGYPTLMVIVGDKSFNLIID
jgi:integrative and conjugative element protein (TIGR02256 family)